MDAKRRILVVLNPRGGQADPATIEQSLERVLSIRYWETTVYSVTTDSDLHEQIHEATRPGYDIVVAAGGDGTVSAVADSLVGMDVPLAILPVGTANTLARELGVPLALDRACELIAGPNETRVIDVMRVRDRHYCLNVSAGISEKAMRDTSGKSKQRFGVFAYIYSGLRALAGLQSHRFELEIDGQQVIARASDILVVNGDVPMPSFMRPSGSRLDDERLVVYIARAANLLDYMILAVHLLAGLERRDRRVRQLDCFRSMHISALPPVALQADGDSVGYTPVDITLVPKALKVIVPPPAPDALAEAGAIIERVRRQVTGT